MSGIKKELWFRDGKRHTSGPSGRSGKHRNPRPRRPGKPKLKRPMVAVDGQGTMYRRDYIVELRMGDESLVDERGISTEDAIFFLLRNDKQGILVSYDFDYEVALILKDLSFDQLFALYTTNEVYYKLFTITWYPGKRITFKVGSDSVTVWDISGFFQMSLDDAAREYLCVPAVDLELGDRMVCIRLLGELVRDNLSDVGITISRYTGHGASAGAFLREYGVEAYMPAKQPKKAVQRAVMGAYYGGRFETAVVGAAGVYPTTPIFAYDIRSAYPAQLQHLPCLGPGCGEWVQSVELDDNGVYFARFDIEIDVSTDDAVFHASGGSNHRWGPLPYRWYNKAISYPCCSSGWYWGVELKSAINRGWSVEISDGYTYKQVCSHEP